jgi:hypothetical protein
MAMIEIKAIAQELKLSTRQVRRIIKSLKLGPVRTVGRVPLFSRMQIEQMKRRNTKPGKKNGAKR